MIVKFEKAIEVIDQDIDDIVCTALEGGITYWCGAAEVVGEYLGEYASDQISRGGSLILYDAESSDTWELTKEKLINGIVLAAQTNIYPDYCWIDGNKLDTCSIDGEIADCIVQYALFGEIIFG